MSLRRISENAEQKSPEEKKGRKVTLYKPKEKALEDLKREEISSDSDESCSAEQTNEAEVTPVTPIDIPKEDNKETVDKSNMEENIESEQTKISEADNSFDSKEERKRKKQIKKEAKKAKKDAKREAKQAKKEKKKAEKEQRKRNRSENSETKIRYNHQTSTTVILSYIYSEIPLKKDTEEDEITDTEEDYKNIEVTKLDILDGFNPKVKPQNLNEDILLRKEPMRKDTVSRSTKLVKK